MFASIDDGRKFGALVEVIYLRTKVCFRMGGTADA